MIFCFVTGEQKAIAAIEKCTEDIRSWMIVGHSQVRVHRKVNVLILGLAKQEYRQ